MPSKIPQFRERLTDPETGIINTSWFSYLYDLFLLTGSGSNSTSLTDLQLAPSESVLQAQVTEMGKAIQALQMVPPAAPAIDTSAATFAAIESTRSLAYNSSGAALTASTENIIAFNTEVFDAGGDYDTTTYRFTAPDTGNYLVTAQASVTNAAPPAGDMLQLSVFKNGSVYAILDFWVMPVTLAGTYTQTVNGSLVVPLTATDYFEISILPVGTGWGIDASGAGGIGLFGVTRLS